MIWLKRLFWTIMIVIGFVMALIWLTDDDPHKRRRH